MPNGKINFTVGFQVDQSGLNQLKSSLARLQSTSPKDLIGIENAEEKLKALKPILDQIQTAMSSAFNANLNTYNIDTFKKNLTETVGPIQKVKQELYAAGVEGENAFRNLTNALMSTRLPLQETHDLLRSMGTTFANTLKWSVASNAINGITSAVSKSWSYIKDLDESLTNIMIVTDKSSSSMAEFAISANKAAKELGKSTTDYTNAALIYYQQGLSDKEVAARTETTLKAANVTGQSAKAVSEQLTAVWNGYKVSAEEAELYVDKLSAVAATTAADLEELSTGMSKVASAANNMGVDVDQLNSMLATTISVTKQAPENVGTAFKTIFARISDIEAGTDSETSFGEYTGQMAKLGFSVLDANGKLREMGDVVEEIGNNWQSLSKEQQVSLAQTMAGTRQYNNLLALFDNWDMYEKAMRTSANAAGTLQKQQDEYMNSIEAHLEQLSTAGERVYGALLNPSDANNLLETLTQIVDQFGSLIESVGGGSSVLTMLIPLLTRAFSGTIANGLSTFITNLGVAREKAVSLKQIIANAEWIKSKSLDENITKTAELRENLALLAKQGILTNEEFNNLSDQLDGYQKALNQANTASTLLEKTQEKFANGFVRIGTGQSSVESNDALARMSKAINDNYTHAPDNPNLWKQGENGEDYELLKESLANAKEKYSELNTQAEKFIEFSEQISQNGEATDRQVNKIKEELKNVLPIMDELAQQELLSPGDQLNYDSLKSGLQGLLDKEKLTSQEFETLEIRARRFGEVIERTSKKGSAAVSEVQNDFNELANGAIPKAEQKVEQYGAALDKSLKSANLEAQIRNFVNLASNVAMVASSFQIISNLGNIWGNENLDSGEKLLQTVQNLSSALAMASPLLIAAGKGITNLAKAKKAATLASNQAAAAEAREAMAKSANTAAEKLSQYTTGQSIPYKKKKIQAILDEALATNALTKEQYEELSADIANNTMSGKQIALKATNVLTTNAETFATNEHTVAENANTVSLWGNVKGWLAKNGAMMAYIAIAAVAVAAAVGFAVAMVKQYDEVAHAEERAAEKAAKSAEEQKQNYQAVAQAYQDLKDKITDHQDQIDALKELTAGTQEWRDVMREANESALELLNAYPELAKYTTRVNGALSFTQEGLDKIIELQSQQVASAQGAWQYAEYRKNQANVNLAGSRFVDQQQVLADRDRDAIGTAATGVLATGGAVAGGFGGVAAASAIGAKLGTAAGSVAPGVGNIIGAVAGAVIGAAVGIGLGYAGKVANEAADKAEEQRILNKYSDENLEVVRKAFADNGKGMFESSAALEKALDGYGNISNELKEALLKNKDASYDLIDALNQKKIAETEQAIAIGGAIVGEDTLSGFKYKAGKDAQADQEKYEQELRNKYNGGFLGLGKKEDSRDLGEQYLETLGLSASNITEVSGDKITYNDANGNSKEITKDAMIEAIAFERMRQDHASSQDSKDLINKSNQLKESIGALFSGSSDTLVLGLAETLSLASTDNFSLSGLTKAQLNKLENTDSYKNAFSQQELDKITAERDLQAAVFTSNQAFNKAGINFDDWTTDQFRSLDKTYANFTNIANVSEEDKFLDIFKNAAGPEQQQLLAYLQTIDFSQVTGEGLIAQLENELVRAKTTRDKEWAEKTDLRVKGILNEIDELEAKANKTVGKEKQQLLDDQVKKLKEQQAILVKNSNIAEQSFKAEKNTFEYTRGVTESLKNAIVNEDWEAAREEIESIRESDGALADQLQLKLENLMATHSEYINAKKEEQATTEDIYQTSIDSFEAQIEYLEILQSRYEGLKGTLEEVFNLYKLLYGESDFSKINGLYDNMAGLSKLSYESKKSEFEEYANIVATGQIVDKDGNITKLEPADIEKYREKAISAAQEVTGALSSHIELLREQMINAINTEFQRSATEFGTHSLEYIDREWKYITEDANKYLTAIGKAYKIQTFELNIRQKIDKLTNKNAQARISEELERQLDILKQTKNLTEDDIALAEKKLSLLEAENALENARNNKAQMRLVRGADGTYSYQYVADKKAIEEAEKQKLQAEYELEQQEKNKYLSTVEEFNSLRQNFAEEYATATTEEDKEQVRKRYQILFEQVFKDNKTALNAFNKYEGAKDITGSSMQEWITGISDQGAESFINSLIQAADENNYYDELETIENILGDGETSILGQLQKIAGNKVEGYTGPNLDTGGYTGAWGPEGRIAMLHEKELVLNKSDTENILNAVNIARAMTTGVMASVAGFAGQIPNASNITPQGSAQTVEQKVEIKAEFPSVTEHSEIEQAFDNLVNLAMQHAYKTVR